MTTRNDKPFMRVELTGPEWHALVGAIGTAKVVLGETMEAGVKRRDDWVAEVATLERIAAKLSDHRAMVVDGVL